MSSARTRRRLATLAAAVLASAGCASSGGVAVLGTAPGAGAGGAAASGPVTYYDVHGDTVGEVARSLQSRGRHGFGGWTRWQVRWDYEVSGIEGRGCSLARFVTDADVRTTLPRLADVDEKDPALRAEWSRFLAALREHEAGHAAIALDAAAALERGVRGVGATSGTCRSLGNRIESLCREIIDTHRSRDRRYDQETGHGRTQGAVFGLTR